MRTELNTAGGVRVSLRPASPDDVGFLRSLYADQRVRELSALGWPAAEQQALVEMQFAAQQAGYEEAFPAADHWLVTVAGQPVGRLVVDRRVDEHRVVDLVVESGRRRLGIGTALMRAVMGDASAAGRPLRLSALDHDLEVVAWYRRLGFVVAGERGLHLQLEWSPDTDAGLAAFRLIVLADTDLQQALLAVPDRHGFVARVVEEAHARGCEVTADEVGEALHEQLADVEPAVDLTPATDLVGWTPIRVDWENGRPAVDWCHTEGVDFTEPFFDETVRRALRHPFRLLFRRRTDIDAVRRFVADRPGLAPAGFIFHMSRCGSTLVSQMLAAVPEHLVVSEAGPVDSVLRAPSVMPELTDAERASWLRWMLAALGQPRNPDHRRYFVKFDAWSTLELPLIRAAFPDVPWIFVHRDPIEVLMSHSRRRGAHVIPGVVTVMPEPDEPMPLVEYAARALARICEAALDMQTDPVGTFVDYRSLPRFVVKDLPAQWSLPMSDDAAARMLARAERDAHNPAVTFAPHRAHATPEIEDAAERWLSPLYERLLAGPRAVPGAF